MQSGQKSFPSCPPTQVVESRQRAQTISHHGGYLNIVIKTTWTALLGSATHSSQHQKKIGRNKSIADIFKPMQYENNERWLNNPVIIATGKSLRKGEPPTSKTDLRAIHAIAAVKELANSS